MLKSAYLCKYHCIQLCMIRLAGVCIAEFLSRSINAVFSWVHGKSELQMSTVQAGRFDQPEQASAWLQMCRAINGKFFSEVKKVIIMKCEKNSLKRLMSKSFLSLTLMNLSNLYLCWNEKVTKQSVSPTNLRFYLYKHDSTLISFCHSYTLMRPVHLNERFHFEFNKYHKA